jgi:hypothetical protein
MQIDRQYFPPVVNGSESRNSTEEESNELKSPHTGQNSQKEQKTEATEDDFEVLDKEEIKEAKDAEALAKAASKAEL